MAKDFIVAIELGSSKMTGIAGKKNPDGSISVLAVAKEDSTSCIRKGAVYNIDKTAQGLTNIVGRLRTALQTDIRRVYVGVGGQSMKGQKNVIIKNLPANTIVSQAMVDELMDSNRSMDHPDYEQLGAITQEYKVDTQYQADPVGIQARRLEGNFLNIVWRKSFLRNLNKCFDQAGIIIGDVLLSPVVMADNVLTEAEKRAGCLLVDLGAETTTVSVYYRGTLRYLAVLPLGGNNVTKDLTSLHMDEREAEIMKLKYASAYTETADIDNTMMWAIDSSRSVSSSKFIEVVEARVLEIVENVWRMVPNEYADKLLGGIVLTGGGANLRNIEKVFSKTTRIEKVRMAKFVSLNINATGTKIVLPHDCTANTILSLLSRGEMDCAGNEIDNTLFGNPQQPAETKPAETATTATTAHTDTRTETAQDPRKAPQPQTAEPEEEEEKETPRRKGLMSRMFSSLKNFGKTLIEEEK